MQPDDPRNPLARNLLGFEPDFEVGGDGEPGDYRALFIPSQVGPYTFQLSGSIHGTKVDLSVTSGPKTFDEVQSPTEAMFPAVDAPTTHERGVRGIDDRVDGLRRDVALQK